MTRAIIAERLGIKPFFHHDRYWQVDADMLIKLIHEIEQLHKPDVGNSGWTEDDEKELQRLVLIIKYPNGRSTINEMIKADELTRRKWKAGR